MTQEEILQYNKRCADFLGYKLITPEQRKNPEKWNQSYWEKETKNGRKVLSDIHLPFHSDCNSIMKVKEAICKLDIIDEFNVHYDSVAKGYHCSILPAFKNTFEGFYTKVFQTEKEAVVQAINKLLTWYEQNK